MSTKGEPLFSDTNLATLISWREQLLIEKIAGISRIELEEKTMEEWREELEAQFRWEAASLKPDDKKVFTKSVKVSSDAVGAALFGGGQKDDKVEHRIDIPFDGDPELFFCEPSAGLSRSAPPAIVEENTLSLFYIADDVEKLASEQKSDLITINKCLKRINREITEFNESLKETILKKIDPRKVKDSGDATPIPGTDTPGPAASTPHEPPNLQSPYVTFIPGKEEELKDEPESMPEPDLKDEKPAPYVPSPVKDGPQIKFIVDLDLFSYSDISYHLEQSLGARAVQVLNQQIRNFVASALETVGARIEQMPITGTGDGAILAFDSVEPAIWFAEAIHHAADKHNQGKTTNIARRHFRVGISKGEIILEQEFTKSGEFKQYHMAGTPIAIAVRLESNSRTGEVLICSNTYADLPEEMRSQYGQQETVKGKRTETFLAHRKKVVEPVLPD